MLKFWKSCVDKCWYYYSVHWALEPKLATRSAHFLHNFSVFSAFLNPFTNTTRSHLYRGQTLDKAKSENKSKQGGLWLEVFWFGRVRSSLIVMIQRGLEIFWVGGCLVYKGLISFHFNFLELKWIFLNCLRIFNFRRVPSKCLPALSSGP